MTICSSFLSFSSIIIYHFHIFHRNLMRLRAQVKNVQIMKWNDLPYLIGCQDLLIQTIQTYILEERMAWCPIYWHFVPQIGICCFIAKYTALRDNTGYKIISIEYLSWATCLTVDCFFSIEHIKLPTIGMPIL
jgi:hypothetical protein